MPKYGARRMTEIFLDTSFAIALTVPGDAFHAVAVQWAGKLRKERALVATTQGILAEIGDFFLRSYDYRLLT